jgi:hypothetical protein
MALIAHYRDDTGRPFAKVKVEHTVDLDDIAYGIARAVSDRSLKEGVAGFKPERMVEFVAMVTRAEAEAATRSSLWQHGIDAPDHHLDDPEAWYDAALARARVLFPEFTY